jgi:HSP20 family protein
MALECATDESFGNVARQMGKALDQLIRGYYSFYANETWTPSVNLYETDESYQVCVDLAGVDKEKIDIEVHGQRLTIKGNSETGTESQHRRTRVHLMEIDHGAFMRVVELPRDVVNQRITAEHRNGILWIELPKK